MEDTKRFTTAWWRAIPVKKSRFHPQRLQLNRNLATESHGFSHGEEARNISADAVYNGSVDTGPSWGQKQSIEAAHKSAQRPGGFVQQGSQKPLASAMGSLTIRHQAAFWGGIAGGLLAWLGLSAEADPATPVPTPSMTFALAEAVVIPTTPIAAAKRTQASSAYGKLPLYFEPNQGQTDPKVKFLTRGPGYALFLTSTEAVLRLQGRRLSPPSPLPLQEGKESGVARAATPSPLAGEGEGAVLRMKLLGAHASPEVSGIDPLPGKVNYFQGKDLASWRTGIPIYAQVRYDEVYPGIALIYYGHQRQLEYDFVVAPGADPNRIRLAFEGTSDTPHLDEQGNLILPTTQGEIRLHKPIVYQQIDGQRRGVTSRCVLHLKDPSLLPAGEGQEGGVQVGVEVAAYDRSHPLVIDPVLGYSTYLGGSNLDGGVGIAVDEMGQAYVTGSTLSTDLPTHHALQPIFGGGFDDAFVVKLSADGTSLVYATYLGGSHEDIGLDIAVDGAGNAYVTGDTESADFPTHHALQPTFGGLRDAFVAKLSADGSALVYATYLGGSNNDVGIGIAVDERGQAYVTGSTLSTDFPTRNALQPACAGPPTLGCVDAFAAKLSAEGTALLYSTYLGGNDDDGGLDIAVDRTGQTYVTGDTRATDFPTRNALQPACAGPPTLGCVDAFVAKLSAEGAVLLYSTYLGGSDTDAGVGIAVDGAGQAHVIGRTLSTDFPTQNALQPAFGGFIDGFIAKLSAEGAVLLYSTYLGGSDIDQGSGIALDGAGNTLVTGTTDSVDFPTHHALQPTFGGFRDAFVTKLGAEGTAFVYSTYLGGAFIDHGSDIAVDGRGNAYLTGDTDSPNFPTQQAPQPTCTPDPEFGLCQDAFIAQIRDSVLVNSLVRFEPLRDTFRTISDVTGCPAGFVGKFLFEAQLTNTGSRVLTDLWVQLQTLSGDHLLLTSEGLIGPLGSFAVPEQEGFADRRLSPAEFINVRFTVCLKQQEPLRLLVNVHEVR